MNISEVGRRRREERKMSQSTSYKILSQMDSKHELKNERKISLEETSDELATSSSQDSLDLVLLELGNKRKVRRKKRPKMGITSFDGAESYEVSRSKVSTLNRFLQLPREMINLRKDILREKSREAKGKSLELMIIIERK